MTGAARQNPVSESKLVRIPVLELQEQQEGDAITPLPCKRRGLIFVTDHGFLLFVIHNGGSPCVQRRRSCRSSWTPKPKAPASSNPHTVNPNNAGQVGRKSCGMPGEQRYAGGAKHAAERSSESRERVFFCHNRSSPEIAGVTGRGIRNMFHRNPTSFSLSLPPSHVIQRDRTRYRSKITIMRCCL